MKILKIIIGLFFGIAAVSFSDTVDQILSNIPAEQRARLEETGEVTRYFFTGEDPSLLFRTSFSREITQNIQKLKITMGVESIYFFKTDKDIPILDIYNTLLSIRSMEGIEYYSQSRKKMRTLFTKSYVINNLQELKPVADPVLSELLEQLVLYINQTDKTFGENIYKTTYRTDGNAIWVEMTNETPMKYKFIRMVNPGNISINLLVKKTDEGIIFYGLTGAKTFSFLGIERSKKESFYNRIKALYNWFVGEIEKK